jgi:hypothetical protein
VNESDSSEGKPMRSLITALFLSALSLFANAATQQEVDTFVE